MKRILYILGLVVVMSSAGYYLTLYFLPNYIYSVFQNRAIGVDSRSENEFVLMMAPDEESRLVVKPNPDFAYGSCFYNLKDGPLRITGQLPDSTYWSVAMYQPNTINFYVKNDLQFGSSDLNLILTREKRAVPNVEQVIAPTERGFILIRLLIANRSDKLQEEMKALLKSVKVSPLD